jgi:hypothetical protein
VRNGHKAKTVIILAEVLAQPLLVLRNSGVVDEIGTENVFGSLEEALDRAGEVVALRPTTDTHAVAVTDRSP